MIDLDIVHALVDSLYGNGDLSTDQASPILEALDLARGQRQRAEKAEQHLGEAQDYITRLRRWGSRLLLAIDQYPQLIPIYASALRWRIDGPPAVVDDDIQLMPVFAAACAFCDAVKADDIGHQCEAEELLLAAVEAIRKEAERVQLEPAPDGPVR